ncbi:selenoprotein, putative [Plasmodium knowlesi strain H]|nr:putative Selenoprotein [Plasmodium knowlesi]SBO19839.1 selenoprotein, putative [Plasmodium knowlesi strain H]SBO22339.1 selenoprotein, putative [Plasmodium knowlesi strain H]
MNRKKENQENEGEYENVLRDRKLKYENLRKKSTLHNRFMSPIFNLINSAINFLKTLFNILAIFFKTLFGLSNGSNTLGGRNGDGDDDFFNKKRKMGTLQKSRMMELKNLGTCLGSS